MFSLFRIDDRLVHGQTMIKLLPNYPCDGIIIINDEIAENAQMKSIYQSVLPGNVKLHVFKFENAVKKLNEAKISKKRYYLINKGVMDYEKLLKLGFKVTEPITVSCCNKKEGSVAVNNGFYLLPEEIDAYNRLDEQGYQFEIMTMMSKWPVSWKSFKNKK